MNVLLQRLSGLALMMALAACGGGGGGSSSDAAPAKSAISVSPASVSMTLQAGAVGTALVDATVTDQDAFKNVTSTIFAELVDSQQVLDTSIPLMQKDALHYTATIHTRTGLATGHYTGNFQLHLCVDLACHSEIDAPLSIPYDITVTAAGANAGSTPTTPTPTLTPTPTPTPTPSATVFGTSGFNATPRSSTTVSFTLGGARPADLAIDVNTGLGWSASTPDSWLLVHAAATGSGSFGVTFNPDGLTAGTYTGSVVLTALDGEVLQIPVVLKISGTTTSTTSNNGTGQASAVFVPALRLSQQAVVFSNSAAAGPVYLNKTIQVSSNDAVSHPWTARSSTGWLSVTASGNSGAANSLGLTVNTSVVNADTVYTATVQVSSSDAGVTPATLRVSYIKYGMARAPVITISQPYQHIVADPLRPYVYVNNNGSVITAYDVRTGAQLHTLTNPVGSWGEMAVSPDGSTLYALDPGNRNLRSVNLDTWTVGTSQTLLNAVNAATPMIVVHPESTDVVVLGDGSTYTAGYASQTLLRGTLLAAGNGGQNLYAEDTSTSPATIRAWLIDTTGNTVTVTPRLSSAIPLGASIQDLAVSPDGAHVYVTGDSFACLTLDNALLATSSPQGTYGPGANVQVAADGHVVCSAQVATTDSAGSVTGNPDLPDVWVSNVAGSLLGSFAVSTPSTTPGVRILPRQLVTSAGSSSLVVLTSKPALSIYLMP